MAMEFIRNGRWVHFPRVLRADWPGDGSGIITWPAPSGAKRGKPAVRFEWTEGEPREAGWFERSAARGAHLVAMVPGPLSDELNDAQTAKLAWAAFGQAIAADCEN